MLHALVWINPCIIVHEHPTKLTVVWDRPDFAVSFLCTNHRTTFHVRVGSLRLIPTKYSDTL